MKHFTSFGLFGFLLFVNFLNAQVVDTNKIYSIVDIQARFPGCDTYSNSGTLNDSCTQRYLLEYIYKVIQYPEEARSKNVEGQAVVKFVVERSGEISNIELLKDPGSGLGTEALKAVKSMNEVGYKWTPSKYKGVAVKSYITLPIKFKLEEEPPFLISEKNDTIYTRFDSTLLFNGGELALKNYLAQNIKYPSNLKDCKSGLIQTTILVKKNGDVEVLDMFDFNSLGADATYEGIKLALSTKGKWRVATYGGKPVNASYPLRIIFKSNSPSCKVTSDNFDKALALSDEAQVLSEKGENDKALAKLNEAIKLDALNMEYYYMRGSVYMVMNKKAEACSDFTKVKETLGVNWVDAYLPLLCPKAEVENSPK